MTKNLTRTWGFFGGTVEYDGRGYHIVLHNGAGEIYLERNEASSLVSLLWKILFTRVKRVKDVSSRGEVRQFVGNSRKVHQTD